MDAFARIRPGSQNRVYPSGCRDAVRGFIGRRGSSRLPEKSRPPPLFIGGGGPRRRLHAIPASYELAVALATRHPRPRTDAEPHGIAHGWPQSARISTRSMTTKWSSASCGERAATAVPHSAPKWPLFPEWSSSFRSSSPENVSLNPSIDAFLGLSSHLPSAIRDSSVRSGEINSARRRSALLRVTPQCSKRRRLRIGPGAWWS